MSDFSIDMMSRRIYDHRTRRYFREVHTSYTTGNYRSAVVMLWSIVVCDLLFKLDELVSMYVDNTARAILAEVETKRQGNPKSPEWEMHLVSLVAQRTELLSSSEFSNLMHLQNHRHLSAHPVLTQDEVLFSPTADDTRAHIRNALEAVLTKPPIMTKKVFDTLVEELERVRNLLPDDPSLSSYLESKFFPHFVPSVSVSVFRSLWQLVFVKIDELCDANRAINFRTLCILHRRQPEVTEAAIRDEPRRFSGIVPDGDPFRFLISFLQRFPSVYQLLDEGTRTIIVNYSKQGINSYCRCTFIHESLAACLAGALERVAGGDHALLPETFGELLSAVVTPAEVGLLAQLGQTLYTSSWDYDTANATFDAMVKPLLDRYDEDQIRHLLTGIEGNAQTYERRRAAADHILVRQTAEQLIPGFAVGDYPQFAGHLAN